MSLRIVFMGTPDFAVPSLKALVAAGHDVVGVVCQPDRPRGRSGKPAPCEVKVAALELGLNVLQFERIRRQEGLDALRALDTGKGHHDPEAPGVAEMLLQNYKIHD